MSDDKSIIAFVDTYYSAKIREFGAIPQGVDWNSAASQEERFRQVLSVCPPVGDFSLNDIGCGYGALLDALDPTRQVSYTGYDISQAMIAQARQRYLARSHVTFTSERAAVPIADYTVASGIFSVKGPTRRDDWFDYAREVVDFLRERSAKGFAFNMLTANSDSKRMRADLYYADPVEMFEYCRRKFSRWTALLHDYGLYEFTIRVRLL